MALGSVNATTSVSFGLFFMTVLFGFTIFLSGFFSISLLLVVSFLVAGFSKIKFVVSIEFVVESRVISWNRESEAQLSSSFSLISEMPSELK